MVTTIVGSGDVRYRLRQVTIWTPKDVSDILLFSLSWSSFFFLTSFPHFRRHRRFDPNLGISMFSFPVLTTLKKVIFDKDPLSVLDWFYKCSLILWDFMFVSPQTLTDLLSSWPNLSVRNRKIEINLRSCQVRGIPDHRNPCKTLVRRVVWPGSTVDTPVVVVIVETVHVLIPF